MIFFLFLFFVFSFGKNDYLFTLTFQNPYIHEAEDPCADPRFLRSISGYPFGVCNPFQGQYSAINETHYQVHQFDPVDILCNETDDYVVEFYNECTNDNPKPQQSASITEIAGYGEMLGRFQIKGEPVTRSRYFLDNTCSGQVYYEYFDFRGSCSAPISYSSMPYYFGMCSFNGQYWVDVDCLGAWPCREEMCCSCYSHNSDASFSASVYTDVSGFTGVYLPILATFVTVTFCVLTVVLFVLIVKKPKGRGSGGKKNDDDDAPVKEMEEGGGKSKAAFFAKPGDNEEEQKQTPTDDGKGE